VLAAHVTTMMRRLDNSQREGQAPVAEAEATIGQTTINQKASAIAEETEVVAVAATAAAVARGSGGSGNGDSGRGA
jgi:type IV secretory pathway TrbL component